MHRAGMSGDRNPTRERSLHMCGACSAAFRHVLRNELRIIESVCPLQNSGDSPKNHIVAIAKNRGWNDGGAPWRRRNVPHLQQDISLRLKRQEWLFVMTGGLSLRSRGLAV